MQKPKQFYKTGWVLPFIDGRCQFNNLRDNYGVYIIKNPSGVIVYVGVSHINIKPDKKVGSLKKTAARHFYPWPDRKQRRFYYPQNAGYKIRFLVCSSSQATRLEQVLRVRLKPKDNPIVSDLDARLIAELEESRSKREAFKEIFGYYQDERSQPVEDCPF